MKPSREPASSSATKTIEPATPWPARASRRNLSSSAESRAASRQGGGPKAESSGTRERMNTWSSGTASRMRRPVEVIATMPPWRTPAAYTGGLPCRRLAGRQGHRRQPVAFAHLARGFEVAVAPPRPGLQAIEDLGPQRGGEGDAGEGGLLAPG